jgi:hypothetical protein
MVRLPELGEQVIVTRISSWHLLNNNCVPNTILCKINHTLHRLSYMALRELYEIGFIIIPTSTEEKMKTPEVKKHIQSHRVSKRQSLDLNLERFKLSRYRLSTSVFYHLP